MAGDDGHQLAAAAEQPVEDLGGDGVLVLADDREVARDHPQHVARLARPGHRHRLASREGDGAGAGVPRCRGHLEDVLVEPTARLVDGDRREALDLGVGRDDSHAYAVVGDRGARRELGDPQRVTVVGQHDHLGPGAADDRVEHLAGGGAPTRAAVDHDRAGLLEELAQPRAGRDGDDAPPRARRLGLLARRPVVGEVGDPDAVWTPRLDAGLDRGADIVDVHMDVPQLLVADDHEGVAEGGEAGAEPPDAVRGRVEQVHHLVRRPALAQVVARLRQRALRHRDQVTSETGGDRDRSSAGHGGVGGVEDDGVAAPARVDHPGVAEGGELTRRGLERCARGRRSRAEDVAPAGVGISGQRDGRLGGGTGDREHGALDRHLHGGVARLRGQVQGVGEHDHVALVGRGLGESTADRAQHLAQDDAGVAARTEERPATEGGQHRRERRLRARRHLVQRTTQRVAGRRDGEVHVRAGVAVGDGIDVERVDLLARRLERVGGDVDEAQDDGELDAAAGAGCFHRLPRGSGAGGSRPPTRPSEDE
ncbi:unannotated protein [freshwater metagenome]|uniref:Unannotated protein n=1 Tax=freshwater metagenome TaxID=449393 RepID=A0A6J6RIQ2_9ZZZZ